MTNTDDKYSTNPLEGMVEAISEYITVSESKNFDKSKLSRLPKVHFSGDDIKDIHDALTQVLNELSFIKIVTLSKLKYVYQGANMCYIEGNVIGLAVFTRSILEHIAIYAFVIKQAEKTIENLENQNSPRKALEVLTKLSNFCKMSYYGTGDRNTKLDNPLKPIHIHDAIRTLDERLVKYYGILFDGDYDKKSASKFLFHEEISEEEIGEKYGIPYGTLAERKVARTDYDFLCDFVHPNYGSNFLVSSGTIAEGAIDIPNDNIKNLSILFVKKCLRYWIYYTQLTTDETIAVMKLLLWNSRSFKRGAKANRIFVKKKLEVKGDGKTIESAYYFPDHDQEEDLVLFFDFLKEKGTQEFRYFTADVSEDIHVYRIFTNNRLDFFFKMKSSLGPE